MKPSAHGHFKTGGKLSSGEPAFCDSAPVNAAVVVQSGGDDGQNQICAMPCRHRLTLQRRAPNVLAHDTSRSEDWGSSESIERGQVCGREGADRFDQYPAYLLLNNSESMTIGRHISLRSMLKLSEASKVIANLAFA